VDGEEEEDQAKVVEPKWKFDKITSITLDEEPPIDLHDVAESNDVVEIDEPTVAELPTSSSDVTAEGSI